MNRLVARSLLSLAAVAIVTFAAYRVIPVNATTAGFAYLLVVLVIASSWGFVEALLASIAATLAFNYFFFQPIGTFTIEDPNDNALSRLAADEAGLSHIRKRLCERPQE